MKFRGVKWDGRGYLAKMKILSSKGEIQNFVCLYVCLPVSSDNKPIMNFSET